MLWQVLKCHHEKRSASGPEFFFFFFFARKLFSLTKEGRGWVESCLVLHYIFFITATRSQRGRTIDVRRFAAEIHEPSNMFRVVDFNLRSTIT